MKTATRLNIGEGHACAKCRKQIPAEEAKTLVGKHWLDQCCLRAWYAVRDAALSSALVKFLDKAAAPSA